MHYARYPRFRYIILYITRSIRLDYLTFIAEKFIIALNIEEKIVCLLHIWQAKQRPVHCDLRRNSVEGFDDRDCWRESVKEELWCTRIKEKKMLLVTAVSDSGLSSRISNSLRRRLAHRLSHRLSSTFRLPIVSFLELKLMKLSTLSAAFYFLRRKPDLQKNEQTENV